MYWIAYLMVTRLSYEGHHRSRQEPTSYSYENEKWCWNREGYWNGGMWSCKWPRGGSAREACRCLSWYSPGILETLTKLIKPVEASLGRWRSPLQLRLAQANPPLRLITHLWFRKGLIKCQLIGDKRWPFLPLLALIRAAWSLFTCVTRGLMRGGGGDVPYRLLSHVHPPPHGHHRTLNI